MDGVVLHQQHIPRTQAVHRVLKGVVHAAGNEQHELVKVVEVEIPLLPGGVAQVEVMII